LVFSEELVIAPDIATGGRAASWLNGGLQLYGWCWNWIRDLLGWVDDASGTVDWVHHLVESAFLAGTILVEDLVRLTFGSVTASLVLANSTVEWAVLAGTVLQDPLSEVASVWTAFGAVTLSSGVGWAISALSTGGQSLSISTPVWDASLSIFGGSGVWVTRSAPSIDLENFSGSAWGISASFTFIEGSGEVFAVFTGAVFEKLLSLCADIWSALSAISLGSGVQLAVLTVASIKESLPGVADIRQAFSAVLGGVHEWWAVFLMTVAEGLGSGEAFDFHAGFSGFVGSLVGWAVGAGSIWHQFLVDSAWVWSAHSAFLIGSSVGFTVLPLSRDEQDLPSWHALWHNTFGVVSVGFLVVVADAASTVFLEHLVSTASVWGAINEKSTLLSAISS